MLVGLLKDARKNFKSIGQIVFVKSQKKTLGNLKNGQNFFLSNLKNSKNIFILFEKKGA
jgi:hypothetical protein